MNRPKVFYTDINGNTATAYGLVAAAEKAGVELFLGSYPITPATDILQELSKRKDFGVKALQMEDEIAGITSSIGASFAGCLAATSTSGPGLSLKSEALGLAVMTELPLVVIDVQRSGPSTGMPTKSEQSDLNQALYGRNGESPLVVMAAASPTDCFESAFEASKIALEHMTPVILLTDGYIANGSSAWRIPDMNDYPEIKPPYVQNKYNGNAEEWNPYFRDENTLVRYWGVGGNSGIYAPYRRIGKRPSYRCHLIESRQPPTNGEHPQDKDRKNSRLYPRPKSNRRQRCRHVDCRMGGTYGHLLEASLRLMANGKKVAYTHFRHIYPLPRNTHELLKRYKKVIVAEQNEGQFANYLNGRFQDLDNIHKYNRVEGQPFKVSTLIEEFTKIMEEK